MALIQFPTIIMNCVAIEELDEVYGIFSVLFVVVTSSNCNESIEQMVRFRACSACFYLAAIFHSF